MLGNEEIILPYYLTGNELMIVITPKARVYNCIYPIPTMFLILAFTSM